MRSSLLLAVFSLLVYLVTIPMCESFIACTPCRGLACDKEPATLCLFGETRNYCGERVCNKGPNGKCGGLYNLAGVCGEGLTCRDNRCRGCYIDGENGEYRCYKNDDENNDMY